MRGKLVQTTIFSHNIDMKRRQIGDSELSVSEICLGSMNWGQQCDEADAHEQLDFAIDQAGINFIDTAEVYPIPPSPERQGLTETYIGNWLAKRNKRDDLVIATKVSAADGLMQTRDPGSPAVLTAEKIREAIDGSLSRLQTDYVDLYQVHWPERHTNFFGVRGYQALPEEDVTSLHETLSALGELVSAGKVRYIGLSNETPWGVMEFLRLAERYNLPKIVSIQNQYSLLNRTFEIGLSEICLKENIGLLVYSALNMGVLSGKYLGGARPEKARFSLSERNEWRYNPERAQPAIQSYVDLARRHNLDPSQMALAFARQRAFTTSLIIGATTMKQLRDDIASAELQLCDEILAEVEAIHLQMPDMTH